MTTTATELSQRAIIEYPDDDGEPMADNTLQFKWIVLIKEGIEHLFSHDPSVFVAGNLLWYPVEGNPTIRTAPDTMVAFGRPKGRRGSYKQWEEGTVAPQVVFEVLSPGNRPAEMIAKRQFYEKYGVEEYYIYDPDDGSLEGWLRDGDRLKKVPEMNGFISPLLRIRFEPGEGPDALKIIGPDGEPFVTFGEEIDRRKAAEEQIEAERQRADAERLQAAAERRKAAAERRKAEAERQKAEAERQKAKAERQKAEAERQRAESADERSARYAAKLRELGVEPDGDTGPPRFIP